VGGRGRKLFLIIDLIFDRLKMGGLGDVVKSSKSMLAIKYERTPFFWRIALRGGTYFLAVQKKL